MMLSRYAARRLTILATVASAGVALIGALAMRDRVRLVDIVTLFFGGVGAGAGLTTLFIRRRQHGSEPDVENAAPAPTSL